MLVKISVLEIKFGSKTKSSLWNASLDRIDSKQGYIVGNVRWVHKIINKMRMDLTDEEFISWCKLVVKNNKH